MKKTFMTCLVAVAAMHFSFFARAEDYDVDTTSEVPQFENGEITNMTPVTTEGAFQQLGIREGDVITEVNGQEVTDPAQAVKAFDQTGVQDLRAVQNGAETEIHTE